MVLLVDGLGVEFRMTPPRGDNWAGVLGMTAAGFVFLARHGPRPAAWALLVGGTWGGIGFAAAAGFKLLEVKYVPVVLSHWFGAGTWQTNWHSVLEQTYGFINGVGIAAVMFPLARRLPPIDDDPPAGGWVDAAAVAFVLMAVPYVNLIKNVPHWVRLGAFPADLYGVPARVWFDAGAGLAAAAGLFLLVRHRRRPLAAVPEDPLGRVQLLYLVLLWVIVAGDFMRAVPPFAPQRLITEGVIFVNAVVCTVLALCGPRPTALPDRPDGAVRLARTALGGLVALAVVVAAATAATRAAHGDTFAGHGRFHVRFGPDAKTGKPVAGQNHP
jgi:hypothetical protein